MTLTLNRKNTIFYYIAIAVIAMLLAVFYYNSIKVNATEKWVEHTQKVIDKNNEILLELINIETSARGFALTNNETFLDTYYVSQKKIIKDLETLLTLTKDNPSEQIKVKKLKTIISERVDITKSLITNTRNNNTKVDFTKLIKGKILTDTIRLNIKSLNSEALSLLKQKQNVSASSSELSQILLYALFFLLLVLVFFIFYLFKNHNKRNSELESYNINQKEASQYSLSLIEASLDPLVTINNEGKITDLNQATVRITGIEKDNLIGSDFFDYFTDHQKAREVYQEVFTNGSVTDAPLTIRHKEGKLTDVLFNGSVYKDKSGIIKGVVIVARDIAEQKWALDLRSANNELAFQNDEKEKRADELAIANKELLFQNDEKEKRAAELVIANKELAFQNEEKEKRADELSIANIELEHQYDEKEKRAAELLIANLELEFQNDEKEKRADELEIANKELEYQNKIKEKKAAELIIANKELAFQNTEKEKRAQELVIANKELLYQKDEKQNRADELEIADKELDFQNQEKEKRAIENKELEAYSYSLKLASQYSLSLIEASRDPLFTISADGKITDTNQASVRVTDVSKENLIGSDFITYFTEPEKAKKGYQEVFSKGFVVDYPLTIKDGKLTPVLFNGSVYKDENENIIGAVVVARDITEQKKAEKELIQSLKEVTDYKLALDASAIVDITDKNGIILFVNENYVKISKYSSMELIGGNHKKVTSRFHEKEFTKTLWATISGGNIWQGEIRNTNKDGQHYWLNMTIVPFLDEKGIPYQYVAISIDITDQKTLETQLTEAKVFAELATEIAEQAQNKAESSTKIAEVAVKSKQQFLSNMSHEIRTPMNAIIGFTKVALKTDLSAKQREYLSAIQMSGDALIVLINDILDLAKVDAGKMVFEKVPFKLQVSITAMLHVFETKIQEKNLELVTQYDKNIPEVFMGDPVRLHQIILNLISNAIKFTSKGIINVNVRLLHEDKEKATVEFEVADTGIGISEEKLGDIFENFQQASSNTSRLYGGTGLGLAIVKQLVEQQGGTITVKSKVDEGSSFSFILDFPKTTDEAEIDSEIIEIDQQIKNIKVLVVEDMALNQLLMKTVLDDFGFERDIAENGQIAIDKLKTKSYDIVLMDLQMPVMSGFEATNYIRKVMNSKIPIIALTADVTTVDLAKCKAVGMDDYIAKPIDERLLYSKIIGLVKKPTVEKRNKRELNMPIDTKKVKYIDLKYLNQRTKANPQLMMEMISLYLAQTPPIIVAMKQSLLDNDFELLHASMHKIIPSFSIMGISSDFEDIARKIEEYDGANQFTERINAMALQLEVVCEQACKELEIEYNLLKNTLS